MPTHKSVMDAVEAADRQKIIESFDGLKKFWKAGRWLSVNNRYRQKTAERVKEDKEAYQHSNLRDYIGASTLGHCFDGWSYLGRATEAELAGDPGSARHLGYYAELRAAMSLLAGEGIGIFNNCHIVVKADGTCSSFGEGSGTHLIVWEVLKEWSNSTAGSNRVMDTIRPNGTTLAEWVSQFGGSAQFVPSNWLEQWGLDLARLKADRNARNVASYRPASLSGASPMGIERSIAAVDKLWAMCEPGAGGGFPILDQHLLRQVLVQLFERGGKGLHVTKGKAKFEQSVDRMLDSLVVGQVREETGKFLKFEIEPDASSLLSDASGKVVPNHVDHSKQVLARATLLLRLATGSMSDLLKKSSSDFESELEFWWNEEAVRRRLWSQGVAPDSFADLWEDVKIALDDADVWLESSGKESSHWGFWTEKGSAGWMLSTVERAFLWGLL